MNKINLLKELSRYAVFDVKIVSDILNKSREYSKLVIYRLKQEKLIFEIERNKYTTKKEPLVIASNLVWPSYISCWSALRYYNLTEQLPETFFVITTRARKKRKINMENSKIIFIKVSGKYFFGYAKEILNDFEIFIATKEKALIDSALFKKISFSEIFDIIQNNKDELDFDLLINYLIKIKNKALIKRFGFLLDSLGINTLKLNKYIDYKYIPLDYAGLAKGKKNKKWRVIQNVNL